MQANNASTAGEIRRPPRVFVTGATGYVGSAVVAALRAAGLAVVGLSRSTAGAERVRALGAEPVTGAIEDPAGWKAAAATADALVHAAFDRDAPAERDAAAIEALLEVARAGGRHLVYTSGCWVLGETGADPADEGAPVDHPAEIVAWRPAREAEVLAADGEGGAASAVVRPGMVYGGGGGLVAGLFETAVEAGAAQYLGKGDNRWSLVHRDDLGRLYATIVERRASGVFHGVDGWPVTVAEAARAASEAAGKGGRTRSVPVWMARRVVGAMADALVLDQALAAPRSRALGWAPERPSFPEAAAEAFAEWEAAR